jgi:hypothetical protein
VFGTFSYFNPSLVFASKASGTLSSSLDRKFWTRVKVSESNKHSSLLQYGINYVRKKFYITDPWIKVLFLCVSLALTSLDSNLSFIKVIKLFSLSLLLCKGKLGNLSLEALRQY